MYSIICLSIVKISCETIFSDTKDSRAALLGILQNENMKHLLTLLLLISYHCINAIAIDTTLTEGIDISEEEILALYQKYSDSIESNFVYQQGRVEIGDGLATIDIPSHYKFLDANSSDRVLTDLWGNPPSPEGFKSLGMLVPIEASIMSDDIYVIDITYTADGFVKDDDAKDIDYGDMLKEMQKDTRESNEYRLENGYDPIELIGWASSPYYDADTKKLHWAKELKFGDSDRHTLNYNIRILGRKGYLELNAIGDMEVLPKVKNAIPDILQSVSFTQGSRYEDFNPGMDKVAAYGIGGLIAGKMLMKAGLIAKLGLLLAKYWKIMAVVFVAFGAGIKKFFNAKKEESVSEST